MSFEKGYVPWNKGKTKKDDPRIEKLVTSDGSRLKEYWFKKESDPWNKGVSGYATSRIGQKHTDESKNLISDNRKGKAVGEDNGWWRGGITAINKKIKTSSAYTDWRNSVFRRDNYICRCCGQRGGTLHPHHLKPFALYVADRFKKSNGVTLCFKCHKKLHNVFGFKVTTLRDVLILKSQLLRSN